MSFVYSEAFYLKSRLFAPCVFLALQGKMVGNHGDAFAIGGLAFDAADGVAEVLLQSVHVPSVPCHFDGVTDGSFHSGRGGCVLLGYGGVQNLGDTVQLVGLS